MVYDDVMVGTEFMEGGLLSWLHLVGGMNKLLTNMEHKDRSPA